MKAIKVASIVVLLTFSTINVAAADQFESNINEIAAKQLVASGNDTLTGCGYAQDVMWEAANDIISVLPGISNIAKMTVAFSKIGNNVACKKLGNNASTLAYMAEMASEIAKKEVDSALRTQLTNEADDLLSQLNSIADSLDKADKNKLTQSELTRLLTRLNTIGANASQLEAAGKELSFEVIPALLVVSSVKLGAYSAEYQLSEDGDYKEELADLLQDEAFETIELLERHENRLTDYINEIKKHYHSQIYGEEVGSVLVKYRTDATVSTKDGKLLWEEHYRCQRFVLAFSLCKDYDDRRRQISNNLNIQFNEQRSKMRREIVNMNFANIKAKMMAFATVSKAKNSWAMLMSAQDGRKCIDTTGAFNNGKAVHMWDCNLNNRNQNWFLDDKGYIHSATNFSKCLDPRDGALVEGARLQLWDCVSTAYHQRFKMYPDDTLRPVNAPDLCVDIEGANKNNGAQLHLWRCNENANQRWYSFSHVRNGLTKCMDTSGSLSNGKEIHTWDCGITNANQPWAFSGDGFIRSYLNPKKCLDPTGPSVAQGTEIQMWDCIGGYNFHRWVRKDDKTIRPILDSNMCMDVKGNDAGNGAKIILWQCHGGDNQKWL